jgi:hypothetical protein
MGKKLEQAKSNWCEAELEFTGGTTCRDYPEKYERGLKQAFS